MRELDLWRRPHQYFDEHKSIAGGAKRFRCLLLTECINNQSWFANARRKSVEKALELRIAESPEYEIMIAYMS